ncbi:MAG: pyruvate dehydrogenase (acetyl-transferring), homodimeric type [Deltaproteobacteria bacterium]|nr:pyruvate dehydrogenase (acetyl-transferring), homodimeric type [Deltaproteobacteria bacterium]
MSEQNQKNQDPLNQDELNEWLDSLDYVFEKGGEEAVQFLLRQLKVHTHQKGIKIPFTANTPYINTIHQDDQPAFPGNLEVEWRVRSLIRWNAMAMVVRANRHSDGIGGHISTYASSAMLYEIGFNHFFRGRDHESGGDFIYIQGHASPGIYARAYLEGRLSDEKLENFRRELAEGGGLSSYPHPHLMPHFWEFPTVSMGLSPIMAIYQARFSHYLEDRGLKDCSQKKVWAFLGDGETDEPETLGAITLAAREKLDNLIFVINCNLQRLDGPVRGNGKIIQELEAAFRGAGWNVIKVIWGREWDELLNKDHEGVLVRRMDEARDGDYQKYSVSDGDYIRKKFFGTDPRLAALVSHLSDEKLRKLRRGGHDAEKVYAAFKAAVEHKGQPTVILAKTIKGYGLGEAGEGKNITHSQKKLNEDELRDFRTRFGIPISDDEVAKAPFYRPSDNSPEIKYIKERREALGGSLPERRVKVDPITAPGNDLFDEFLKGSDGREVSTTMAFVRVLAKLLRDKSVGKLIVPIVPDEARTFGMEGLFRQVGIYSHVGQLYEPVDADSLLYYKESTDGQILEEGITEAGAMSSFIAAGTSYANHGVNMIPFYVFYSMFGMQRIGDLVWAASDMRCKGFLVGGTAGRTTLAGEGLQHQDGHSHLLAMSFPNLMCYDPAFAYEIAVIVQDGIKRMYEDREDVFYYMTIENENYAMPAMDEKRADEIKAGIVKGIYCYQQSALKKPKGTAHLWGSGAIMNEVLKAATILEEQFQVAAPIWSVTSYKEIRREALSVERSNLRHPEEAAKVSYLTSLFEKQNGVVVAASDYVKALPDMVHKWVPLPMVSLGTDGFGRSEDREHLRDFFEVDAKHIAYAALVTLVKEGSLPKTILKSAAKELSIDPDKKDPVLC